MNRFIRTVCVWRERLRRRKDAEHAAQYPSTRSIAGAKSSIAEQTEFSRAIELHQTGRLDEAESIYRGILERQPDFADALHYFGLAQAQRQRFAEAVEFMRRAKALDSGNIAVNLNLGNALKALGRYTEALSSYDSALALDPNSAEALNNRGSVLADLGQHEEAIISYGRALLINPAYPAALFNCGVSLAALSRHKEALASFEDALTLRQDHHEARLRRGSSLMALEQYDEALARYNEILAVRHDDLEALFNRGVVLAALERYVAAVASYDEALAVKPDFAEALNNRGIALSRDRQYEAAIESYERALAVNPKYADVHNHLGIALSQLYRHEEALASYNNAILHKPSFAEAFNNRGVLLEDMDRPDEALLSYERALEIKPDYADALKNRGTRYRNLGRLQDAVRDFSRLLEIDPNFDYALGNKLTANQQQCKWGDDFHRDLKWCINAVRDEKRACLPFAFLGISGGAEDHLTCARTFVAHKFPLSGPPLWTGDIYRHDRIRIAYLSADFHNHATAYLMAELFERHNRSNFEISAWSFGPETGDEMRTRLRNAFESFNDVRGVRDIDIAKMLRDREIDIAVDLKGFTQDCRPAIFAQRAVPIQVSYLGYPGTMGAGFIDYIVGDPVVTPVEHDMYYTEQVVRLPDTYQVNDSKRVISKHSLNRTDVGLPESGFVFCCFNNNFKITPEIFDIWMRLLARVEGSVFWFLGDNATASHNLKREAEVRGVSAERLVFAPRVALPDHLARHRLGNLFLDTLPYNAHTTTSDALWAGLPVLTCLGSAFPGRVAASLLRAIGLPDLVTENLADYEALALQLATTPDLLAAVRSRLLRNRDTHPLFDSERFARHIESAYSAMYKRYQRGESPQGFSVEPLPSAMDS